MEMWIELENGVVLIIDCNVVTTDEIIKLSKKYEFKRIAYYHYN